MEKRWIDRLKIKATLSKKVTQASANANCTETTFSSFGFCVYLHLPHTTVVSATNTKKIKLDKNVQL